MLKQERFVSVKYRKWIASLPCCVTGIEGLTQCAHIRSGGNGGMGLKPTDDNCVPLAWFEHALQHRVSEENYWREKGGIDRAKKLALDLYAVKYNTDEALRILGEFRNEIRG